MSPKRPLKKNLFKGSLYDDHEEWTEQEGDKTGRISPENVRETTDNSLLRQIQARHKEKLASEGIGHSKKPKKLKNDED
jgi:hypothetical protein